MPRFRKRSFFCLSSSPFSYDFVHTNLAVSFLLNVAYKSPVQANVVLNAVNSNACLTLQHNDENYGSFTITKFQGVRGVNSDWMFIQWYLSKILLQTTRLQHIVVIYITKESCRNKFSKFPFSNIRILFWQKSTYITTTIHELLTVLQHQSLL